MLLQDLLSNMNLFHRCVAEALQGKQEAGKWIERARGLGAQIEVQLEDQALMEELELLLRRVQSELSREGVVDTAALTLRTSIGKFIAVESQLRHLGGLIDKDYERIAFAVETILAEQDWNAAISAVPRNAGEFRRVIIETTRWTIVQFEHSRNSGKNEKKILQKFLAAISWKSLVGGVVLISNSSQLSHLAPAVGVTSISSGAILMGARIPPPAKRLLSAFLERRPPQRELRTGARQALDTKLKKRGTGKSV